MLDAEILSACIADRAAYERIAEHITAKDMTPAVGFWLGIVKELYDRDSNLRGIAPPVLLALGTSRITQPKQRETILSVVSSLPTAGSPDTTVQVALELKRRNVGLELAAAIAANDDKRQSILGPQYMDLRAATSLTAKNRPEWQDAVPIREIFKKVGQSNRIPLAPTRLNAHINGGALPGHHIVVFGRPEMGKSSFSVNLATVMAANGQRVLYVGNEDQIDNLKARALARAANMTLEQAEADQEAAFAAYERRGLEERLLFSQLSKGSVEALRARVEEWKPTVLVIDQIRNLESGEDGLPARLEYNGQMVRRLLLDYGLIGISVTQAGGSAEGKVWLDMGDMDSSKTGLPGTADLIIGVGGNADMKARGQRALSFPKNKLSSADNSHEGIIVEIDHSRSSFK